jgi:uncharacterized protein
MPTYLTPGIYLEEVPGGPRAIEAVGTSTAAFVGTAPGASVRPGEAVAVNNFTQFTTLFVPDGSTSTPLSHAVWGFFQNGGSRCYVVNTASDVPLVGGGSRRGALDALAEIDEIAIVAAPGASDAASYDALLTHCETLGDRVAILDAPSTVADMSQLIEQMGVATPPKRSESPSTPAPPTPADGEKVAPAARPPAPERAASGPLRPRVSDRGFGAFYFPWLRVRDVISGEIVDVPPSGHMAGIWARTDAIRGVHKAPANETVRGALDLSQGLTSAEQGVLNQAGVNAIRYFSREGIRVWGARTLATDAEWRYLNVRRLMNMIEESIQTGTNWVVFEPNDPLLWRQVRRDVSAFLTRVWRDGALFGRTPEEAFFVKCDEETNPPEVIDAGQLVVVIGIAPVKPAEFVVFRISQFQGGSASDFQGSTNA